MGLKEDYHRKQAERERRDQEKAAKSKFGKNTFRHPDHVARFTFYVAIFTAVLASIGVLQAVAFIQSERAFLTISAMNIDTSKPNNLIIGVETRNGGKSVATSNLYFFLRVSPLPPNPPYTSPSVFRPPPITGGSFAKTTLTIPFPAEIRAQIIKGDIPFFVFGFIEFEDEFSLMGHKRVGFCFRFNHEGIQNISMFDSCPDQAYTYAH